MRYPVHVFSTNDRGETVEWDHPFYLSPVELDQFKAESFTTIWTRPELAGAFADTSGPITLEVTDQWGRVLFEFEKPSRQG